MGNDKSLLTPHAFRDIFALAIHNNKLSRERKEDQLMMYPVLEFLVGDKVLVRNHTRDVWDLEYDVAYKHVDFSFCLNYHKELNFSRTEQFFLLNTSFHQSS